MDNNIERRARRRIGRQEGASAPSPEELQAQQELLQAQSPSDAARRAADLAMAHQSGHMQEEHGASGPATEGEDSEGAPQNRKKNPRRKKVPQKKKPRKALRIILFSLLGLLLIAGGILLKFWHDISTNQASLFNDPTPVPTAAPPTPTLPPDATPMPTPEPTPDTEAILLSEADLEFMKNRVNVLVLGLDESTERENWGSFRTDTMILVTIDFDTSEVTMVSLPRDSYVKLANGEGNPLRGADGESYKFGKINTAFPTGGGAQKDGFAYAMGTVSRTLGGIPVKYYVGFNMNVVKDIVNAMGGLYYEVDTKVSMNGREYEEGYQYLDGQGVLDYCRQRKGSSDIARVERQQRMLKAIFNEMKKTDQLGNIPDVYNAVQANIDTNLSFQQICSLALLAVRMDYDQLNSYTLDGSFLNMKSTSYWGLYTNKIATQLQEIFGISVSIDSDMNVTNIRAILEANRQLIAAELNAAKSAIDTANSLLNSYGEYLTEDAKARLKAARDKCEDAYEEEEKELLDYYTPQLQQVNAEIQAGLQQAGILGGQPAPPEPEVMVPEAGAM